MEPRDMVHTWIDQDIAALHELAAPEVPRVPPRTLWGSPSVPHFALLARMILLATAIHELQEESRALRQEAEDLRKRAAEQERLWPRAWGVER